MASIGLLLEDTGLLSYFNCMRGRGDSEGGKCRFLCCSKERRRKKSTPLPWMKVLVVALVLFGNNFGSLMIFPFLPFMVQDFFPSLRRNQLGSQAGFLGSAFYVGSFFGSLMWGWLADIIGRKPVMILGMIGTIFSIALFGTSQNFAWAIAARFLWGLLNGNIGVAKTYMAEVCDDTNQARGFSVIGTTAGLGRLIGSIIGGFLAQPADKYPLLKLAFFCMFPYLLPCLVGISVAVVALILAILFLKETLNKKKKKNKKTKEQTIDTNGPSRSHTNHSRENLEEVALLELEDFDSGAETDLEDCVRSNEEDLSARDSEEEMEETSFNSPDPVTVGIKRGPSLSVTLVSSDSGHIEPDEPDEDLSSDCDHDLQNSIDVDEDTSGVRLLESDEDLVGDAGDVQDEEDHEGPLRRKKNVTRRVILKCRDCRVVFCGKLKEILRLLRDRRVIVSVLLYSLGGFVQVMLTELFPLLMVGDHESGGYSFDDNEIAVVLTVGALAQLLFQIFLYPYVVRCLGYRHSYRIFLTLTVCLSIILPLSNQITGPIPSDANTTNSSISAYSESLYNSTFNVSTKENSSLPFCGRVYEDSESHSNSVTRVPIIIWLVLCVQISLQIVSRVTFLTSTMIMIGNSTLPATRGTVNGIGQSLVAVGRSLGPILASTIFAWSENNGLGWPFNYHLMFNIIALLCISAIVVSFFMPKSIEKKREETNAT